MSLARATRRISPFDNGSRLKGATDQPISTCPDIAWVVVAEMSPVATGFAFRP